MSKKKDTTETPAQDTPVVETPATEPVIEATTPVVETPATESIAVEPIATEAVAPETPNVSPSVPNTPPMATVVFSGQHVETVQVIVGTKLSDVKLANGSSVDSMMLRNAKGHSIASSKQVEAGSLEVFTYAKAKRG